MKKENQSNVGNRKKSLLQKARTKAFGAGKVTLHNTKATSNKPPVKRIKIKVADKNIGSNIQDDTQILEDRSKISDITASLEATIKGIRYEISKPADDDNIEIESSVLCMSLKPDRSFQISPSKPDKFPNVDDIGKRQPFSTQPVFHRPKYLEKMILAKPTKHPKPIRKSENLVLKKKTMDISKGVRFSAPAPMTLNRCELQMGQEKTAPESKEYTEMQAQTQLRAIEDKKIADAKRFVEAMIKEEFRQEQEFGMQTTNFDTSDNADNFRKKSLVKKILRKIRLTEKESSPVVDEALAAAAIAVEAALASSQFGVNNNDSVLLSEDKARAIAKMALEASKQKKVPTPNFIKQLVSRKATNQIISPSIPFTSQSLQFPIQEVTLNPKEDSISELDASARNMRKIPIAEIRMKDEKQTNEDDSVSTLGTPRIFDQLGKLLTGDFQCLNKSTNRNDGTTKNRHGPGHVVGKLYDEEVTETSPSPAKAFSLPIDNVIRKAGMQIVTDFAGEQEQNEEKLPLSPIEEADEAISPATLNARVFNNSNEEREDILLVPNLEKVVSPSSNPSIHEAVVGYGDFLNIAASKFDVITERTQDQQQHDKYSTEFDTSPGKMIRNKKTGNDFTNEATPIIQVGDERRFFSFVDSHDRKDIKEDLTQVDSQGRFLLERDDAYWDTLSTIASTANDRSSESDEYMNEVIPPGPIPGEITTSSSELNHKEPLVTISGQLLPQSSLKVEALFHAKSGGEGIDSTSSRESGDADNLETSIDPPNEKNDGLNRKLEESSLGSSESQSNKRNTTEHNQSHFSNITNKIVDHNISERNNSDDSDFSQDSRSTSKSSRQPIKMRPPPETLTERSQNKPSQSKNSYSPIRSVSWGFEEIYEDRNSRFNQFDHDTSNSESTVNVEDRVVKQNTLKSQSSAKESGIYSNDSILAGFDEQNLLSRTIELSKDLLGTIMSKRGSENKYGKGQTQVTNPYPHNRPSPETRDDYHQQQKMRSEIQSVGDYHENDVSSMTKFEELRRQRALALAKFRLSQKSAGQERSATRYSTSNMLDRDHVKTYASINDTRKVIAHRSSVNAKSYNYVHSSNEDEDIDLKYTTSDSNASSTPSQKARNLSFQLHEAMEASKMIQNDLAVQRDELSTFKTRYYNKNDEIEQYARKAINRF